MHSPLFLPIVVLVAWTMVMWFWMYATRIPYIVKTRMQLDPQAPRGEQMATLPAQIRWKADNYNHLMEQPTIFYAVTLVLAMMGEGEGLNHTLAWSYVFLRVVHSFVQVSVNIIKLRFLVFILSSLPLIGLIISALCSLLK